MSCAARTWAGPYSALSGRSANVSKKASSAATSFAALVSAILLETCQRMKHDVITLIARTMYIKYITHLRRLEHFPKSALERGGRVALNKLRPVLDDVPLVLPSGFEVHVLHERIFREARPRDDDTLDLYAHKTTKHVVSHIAYAEIKTNS